MERDDAYMNRHQPRRTASPACSQRTRHADRSTATKAHRCREGTYRQLPCVYPRHANAASASHSGSHFSIASSVMRSFPLSIASVARGVEAGRQQKFVAVTRRFPARAHHIEELLERDENFTACVTTLLAPSRPLWPSSTSRKTSARHDVWNTRDWQRKSNERWTVPIFLEIAKDTSSGVPMKLLGEPLVHFAIGGVALFAFVAEKR